MDAKPVRKRNLIISACLGVVAVAIVAVTIFDVPIRSLFFYGMIALCPLMHLLMGHGSHGHDACETSQADEKAATSTPDKP